MASRNTTRLDSQRTASADERLRAFARNRRAPQVNPEIAIVETLNALRQTAGAPAALPESLLKQTFAQAGLSNTDLRVFLERLSILFDSRVSHRILTEIAPIAGQRIAPLAELISLWQSMQSE